MAREIDMQLFERAVDLTATALRGAMGGKDSQPPSYASDLFKEIWGALKEAAKELPEKPQAGFVS